MPAAPTTVHSAGIPSSGERLISLGDIVFTAALPVLMAVAWLTPAHAKPALGRSIAHTVARLKPARAVAEARRLGAPFNNNNTDHFYRDVQTHFHLERLNLFALHGPFAKPPPTRLTGQEHIDAARTAGRGTILWVTPTAHSRTETKLALWQAGHRIFHLSRTIHGFSPTRYGKAVLNPLRTSAEKRFLAGRVVIRDGHAREALAALSQHLARNEIVSITIGAQASKVKSEPFLDGRLTVSTRPVELARAAGAMLLPVVSIREPDGTIRVDVGGPLTFPKDPPGDSGTARAVERLAGFLRPHVLAHPDQFARADMFHAPPGVHG